jgi:hypothetical protein
MDNSLGSEEGEERKRRAGGVPKVYYYPCSTERNSELFSLRRNGSERNSESFASILFHGTEFRAFFSSAEWVRNGIPRFLHSAEQAEFRRNKPIFPSIPSSAE